MNAVLNPAGSTSTWIYDASLFTTMTTPRPLGFEPLPLLTLPQATASVVLHVFSSNFLFYAFTILLFGQILAGFDAKTWGWLSAEVDLNSTLGFQTPLSRRGSPTEATLCAFIPFATTAVRTADTV